MANQKGTGTTWNLPNYAGDLFTADAVNTPIFSAIGGMTFLVMLSMTPGDSIPPMAPIRQILVC